MLSVLNNYRRNKIGSNLLKYYLKNIISKNIKKVELEVRIDNHSAVNFYKKHCFLINDTIKKFYQNEEDAYHMILIL